MNTLHTQMKYIIGVVVVLTLVLSCKEQQHSNQKTNAPVTKRVTFADAGFPLPVLSNQARNAVNNWHVFEELERDMERLNSTTTNIGASETERMVQATDSLLKHVPQNLQSTLISSRVRVLHTRVQLLHELMQQRSKDSTEIANHITETNNAFTNLVVQINEKFEKETIDQNTKTQKNLEEPTQKTENDTL